MSSTKLCLLAGGWVIVAAQAQASVGMYYVETYLDSRWLDTTSSVQTEHAGYGAADQWGSISSPTYYPGTYAFSDLSSSAANPQSVIGTGGYSTADSFLNLQFGSTGFSLYGGGDVTGLMGSGATAQSVTADLVSYVSLNFGIPQAAAPVNMSISGVATAFPGTDLLFRMAEFTPTGSLIQTMLLVDHTSADMTSFSQTWDKALFALTPGNLYSMDLYALPSATVGGSSLGPVALTSEINIVGTFDPIPEPGTMAILLGSAALLMPRARRRSAKK